MVVTDADLAARVAEGDAAAEREVCRRFGRRALLYGLRHLPDASAAADLAQEAMLIVLRALRERRVESPERLASYVLGTCRLVATGMRRGEHRRAALAELPLDRETAEPRWPEVDRERLLGCLMKLDPRLRRVVVMTFGEDRAGDEIAEVLGTTPGNVRVLRHRALAKLHDCIGGAR